MKSHIKKIAIGLVIAVTVLSMAYSALQRITTEVCGIFNGVPNNLDNFEAYINKNKSIMKKLSNPECSMGDIRFELLEKIEFETHYSEIAYEILKKAGKANQLKD